MLIKPSFIELQCLLIIMLIPTQCVRSFAVMCYTWWSWGWTNPSKMHLSVYVAIVSSGFHPFQFIEGDNGSTKQQLFLLSQPPCFDILKMLTQLTNFSSLNSFPGFLFACQLGSWLNSCHLTFEYEFLLILKLSSSICNSYPQLEDFLSWNPN